MSHDVKVKKKPIRQKGIKLNGETKKEIDSWGRKASGGRPACNIDPEEVYKIAKLWCTVEEIASHFDIDTNTLSLHFSEVIKRAREEGKASLRRMQWASAGEGNVTMQIWLGKQHLGQQEVCEEIKELQAERTKRLIDYEMAKKSEAIYKFDDATVQQFNSLMEQIKSLQSTSKIEENNINIDK